MKLSQLGMMEPPRLDRAAAARLSFDEMERRRRTPGTTNETKPAPWNTRTTYRAPLGSTSQVPSDLVGVECAIGRVWAEARGISVSVGTEPVNVTLVASQTGVRAIVEAGPGANITGGSIRFWLWDDVLEQWSLGGVDEPLPTGVKRVATTDQFVTVGGK